MTGYVKYAAKALIAALYSFVAVLVTATIDGSGITLYEWLAAALAALGALVTVFRVSNGPRPKAAKAHRVAPGRKPHRVAPGKDQA